MTEQANTTGYLVQRWALTLSYDGSRFYGWQKQAGDLPTVQTALEQALASIAGGIAFGTSFFVTMNWVSLVIVAGFAIGCLIVLFI